MEVKAFPEMELTPEIVTESKKDMGETVDQKSLRCQLRRTGGLPGGHSFIPQVLTEHQLSGE